MTEPTKITMKGEVHLYGYALIEADEVEVLGHLVIEPYTLVVISGITKAPHLDVTKGSLTIQGTGVRGSGAKLLCGYRWWSPKVLWTRFKIWNARRTSSYVPVSSSDDAEILIT